METTKGVPLKRSLLLNLAAGVLLLGATLLAISLIATERIVGKLSGALTHRVISTTDAQVMSFFEPVQATVEITATRVADGKFDEFPLDALDDYFMPLIDGLPQISSVMYANQDGDEYMLLRSGESWSSRLSRPTTWSGEEIWREWPAGEVAPAGTRRTENYDARSRPWYVGALERYKQYGGDASLRERIHWTPPYTFFTTGEPGVTASLAFSLDSGEFVVIGFDLLLADISRFTSKLEIGERGKVFVLRGKPSDPEGLVIVGLPADERFTDDQKIMEFILRPPYDFGGPVASYALQALELGDEQAGTPIRFRHGSESWWGEIARSRLRTSDDIWIGSVVPEAELLAALPNTNMIVIIATALVLFLAGLQALRLAKRYSQPLEELTERGNRMQRLNFEVVPPVESHITEIRHLSATLERMRAALQSFSAEREDLRVARSVRQMVLPQQMPIIRGLDIAAWHQPADEVGGEIYDLVPIAPDGRRLIVALLDFPGSGVPAALYGSELRAALRSAARDCADLSAITSRIEAFVRDDRPEIGQLRGWLIDLDLTRRTVTHVGFGESEFLHGRDAEATRIAATCPPIQTSGERVACSPGVLSVRAADTILIASDGIVHALAADRRRYGDTGLGRALVETSGLQSAELVARVRKDLDEYATGPRRDRTAVVLRLEAR